MKSYQQYKKTEHTWISQVPFDWNVEKFRLHFSQRVSKVSDKEYKPLSVTKMGIVPQLDNIAKSNDSENRKLVCKGDYVINSRSDRKGSSGLSELEGSVSLINIVLKPRNVNAKYTHYLLRSNSFIEEFYRNGRGIHADLWTTRYMEMRNIYIPIPSSLEQDQIVKFLDHKIAQIDKFIEGKKQEIQLLKELKQAEVNRAVTKGLNPNVEMVDSGIDWLGDIPKHWVVKRVKNVLIEMEGKSIDGNEEPLSMSQKEGIVRSSELSIPNTASTYIGGKIVHKTNLVFNKLKAHLGVFAVSKYDGVVSPDYAVYATYKGDNVDFIQRLFKTPLYVQQFIRNMTGVAVGLNRLYTSGLFKLHIALPERKEQDRIIKQINSLEINSSKAIGQLEKEIELITEYKTSLISEVVTGQIDVRDVEITAQVKEKKIATA